MNKEQKLYSKSKGLRFREQPNASGLEGVIKELEEGQELIFVDGPWIKVRIGNKEGWVHGDYVSEARNLPTIAFKLGVPNLVNDVMTQAVRIAIKDALTGGKNGYELQCTEYVQYRVKQKLGIDIKWPVVSGRHGGKWASIFEKYGTYKVLSQPKMCFAMSFTTGVSATGDPKVNDTGHVAFVEEVYPDESIKISEANWPKNGIYNERILTKSLWQTRYKGRFIQFS